MGQMHKFCAFDFILPIVNYTKVHIMINGKGDEKNAHREIHESG